jgi:hypothetical protein
MVDHDGGAADRRVHEEITEADLPGELNRRARAAVRIAEQERIRARLDGAVGQLTGTQLAAGGHRLLDDHHLDLRHPFDQ